MGTKYSCLFKTWVNFKVRDFAAASLLSYRGFTRVSVRCDYVANVCNMWCVVAHASRLSCARRVVKKGPGRSAAFETHWGCSYAVYWFFVTLHMVRTLHFPDATSSLLPRYEFSARRWVTDSTRFVRSSPASVQSVMTDCDSLLKMQIIIKPERRYHVPTITSRTKNRKL